VIASNVSIVLPTFCVSVLITGFMRRYAFRKNMVDLPNTRSSHVSPTPRGGGLAIVAAFFGAALILFVEKRSGIGTTLALIGGGGGIAVIGFLDDHRQLSAKLRLAVHVGAAIFVVMLLGVPTGQHSPAWPVKAVWIEYPLAVFVFAWSTNLFNFMDGIDGIAGSEAVFVSGAGALLNWLNGGDGDLTVTMLCVSAASLGFLAWNWPPARIFMGDVGSGFLGFTLTTLALIASRHSAIPLAVWPILAGVFLVDATVTLIRRICRGDRWMEPHRTHAYQYLARRLGSHRTVTAIMIAINVGWLLPWAYCANEFPGEGWLCAAAALSPIVCLALLAGAGKREA
jgi:Fuc2NAc and GlcNAc transferase